MKVITANPIILNKKPISSRDKYVGVGGDVQKYDFLNSNNAIEKDYIDNDQFLPAEGDKYAKFDELPSFSNAGGVKRAVKRRREIKDRKLAMKEERTASKADARRAKADAKLGQAQAQKEAAVALGKQDDSAAIAALAQSGSKSSKSKKGLSTGAIIGISVGALALIGVVGYMIYKNKKK